MRLEIGNFHVKDMVFGDATAFSNGVLTINKKEALDVVFEDAHITEAELHIVKPGDMVRITPVKDAFEPRCKVTGNSIFPGFFDSFEPVGQGRTHALKECSVLSVGKH